MYSVWCKYEYDAVKAAYLNNLLFLIFWKLTCLVYSMFMHVTLDSFLRRLNSHVQTVITCTIHGSIMLPMFQTRYSFKLSVLALFTVRLCYLCFKGSILLIKPFDYFYIVGNVSWCKKPQGGWNYSEKQGRRDEATVILLQQQSKQWCSLWKNMLPNFFIFS